MWIVQNETPFQAERAFVRDTDGAETWLVAVKATFGILPDGTTEIAEEQVPVFTEPVFLNDPETSSLRYDSDLVLEKPGTDILLNGHAYASEGETTSETTVTLSIAGIHKQLKVIGDRFWEKSLIGFGKSAIQPFEKIPLVYERAFGGKDLTSEDPKKHRYCAENPVGTGFGPHFDGERCPNIFPGDGLRLNKKRSVGFGPIASHWMPRASFAGTYDDHWQKTRQPLLPLDFDTRFYRSAPVDQQIDGYLTGGESVGLFNVTPSGELRFELPRVDLDFKTDFGDTVEVHQGLLHTVLFEPDEERLIMVWHTKLRCHKREHKLKGTLVSLKS